MIAPQKKRHWEAKLATLARASLRAQEDLLVGICQATQDGLSQADVAGMVDGLSKSGVAGRVAKGREILERRRRGSKSS